MPENMIFIWVWLNSSNIIVFHNIHFSETLTVSFFPVMEKPTVCICSIFLIHSSIAKHLGWFCNCEQCTVSKKCARFFWHIWLGIFWANIKEYCILLSLMEYLWLVFVLLVFFLKKNSRLAFMVSRLVFISTSSIQGLMRQTGTHLPNSSYWCSATYCFGSCWSGCVFCFRQVAGSTGWDRQSLDLGIRLFWVVLKKCIIKPN